MRRLSPIREQDIQSACRAWLEWHGWTVQRTNSGKALVDGRCILLWPEGTPDTLAFKPSPYGQGIVHLRFFEFKVPGKEPTAIQNIRMEELRLYGAECHVVHSLDELIEILE